MDADYCVVLESLPGGDEGLVREGVGRRDGSDGDSTVSIGSDSQTEAALRTDEPVVDEDRRADDRFSEPAVLASDDVVGAIGVSIGSADDPWGVLEAYATERREFTDADAAFVGRIADLLASAVRRLERERELRRTERRYEAVFEDPNILVGLLEPDGTVLDINGTAMEYVDATLEDVVGEPFWETPWWGEGGDRSDGSRSAPDERAVRTTGRDDVREWVERAAAGEYVDFEADLRRPDGEPYRLSGYFRPVTNDDGNVVSVIVSDRDVTDRLERERALEESERRYRTLVEHFPNGAVALVDEDLRYRTVGGRPDDVADVTVEDIEGEPVRHSIPEELAAELVPRYEAAFEGESDAFEAEYDGRVYQFQVVPVRDDDGDVFAALGMSQDVTERTEVERRLEESERRYRTLVENFPDGAVGLFDEDLEYTAVGGEMLREVGVDPADRIGNSIFEVYPDELADEVEPYFHAALEGEANAFEVEYHDRHLQAHTLPVGNADDGVFAGMLVVQDVTEQREYECKLEASNERLEQFAYAASHDLQEPLRMVSSYLQLIEDRYGDELDADGREFLEFAVDGAERMRHMIEGLLQYSRIDTKGDPFEPVDLDAVLEDVRRDLQVKIEEHDAEITAEALPRVLGDESQLQQVFQNLVSNAIEYSGEEPPRVHVTAERREARTPSERTGTGRANDVEWVVSVTDEGMGIDPADRERIFEVFQRLYSGDHAGAGIGLALCERIVERHDGEIWVESEPGEGATFSFTLPAVGADGAS